LRVDRGVHEVAATAALVQVRARRIDAVGRGRDDALDAAAHEVATVLQDIDLDAVAGQRALDEHDPAVRQPTEAEAAGDERRDVRLRAHAATVASALVRVATEIHIPLPNGGELGGVAALPEGAGPHPGCVVVSDIFGLSDDVRRICGRLADEGFAAVAPDLYSHGAKALCVARVMGDLATGAHGRTLDDIEAARAHLSDLPDVDGDRMAIIGFCMGGGFALTYAAQRGGLRAASVNYGTVPRDKAALTTVCPVVGSYGAKDKPFLGHAKRLERHLGELAIEHDVKIYDGVGHSFMNDLSLSSPGWMLKMPNPMSAAYDEAAAEDAWARIFAFFREHLG
jgi:carboxymethylenebutenolidase